MTREFIDSREAFSDVDEAILNSCPECLQAHAECECDGYGEDGDYADYDAYLDEYDYDDSMDGDHESGLASAGWGTDEDYGYYGGDEDW